MAEEKADLKSLEMRIAAIEDKLSKLNITEDELRTYEKVAAALGGQTAAQAQPGISAGGCINECAIARGITPRGIGPRGVVPRTIVPRFVCECNECMPFGGGGSGSFGGGGFGGFGM